MRTNHRTQVIIIGAGPAGMLLALLLQQYGIDTIVLEKQTRAHVEGRVRAGVLERGTVAFMESLGLAERLEREGLHHPSVRLARDGDSFRIAFDRLLSGAGITIYGQSEIMKDLNLAAVKRGLKIHYEAEGVTLEDIAHKPRASWFSGETTHTAEADFIAGCDGFHGVSNKAIPHEKAKTFEQVFPFAWLGVLAEAPPCANEIIYAGHKSGFALASMRSSQRSRYYLQVPPDTNLATFSIHRFWDELRTRLAIPDVNITEGSVLEMSLTPIRSFVIEPMHYGKLYLAGDAAHIVPPTGAKGLNLAVNDVSLLAEAISDYFRRSSDTGLETYSPRALTRVWQAQRFSHWLTQLMHTIADHDTFSDRIWRAEFDRLRYSQSAQKNFAENYAGL